MGGSEGRSGQVRKISPSPGFDPRTVQPVMSRYTDWAIPVQYYNFNIIILWHHRPICGPSLTETSLFGLWIIMHMNPVACFDNKSPSSGRHDTKTYCMCWFNMPALWKWRFVTEICSRAHVCEWTVIYISYIVYICWCAWVITVTMCGKNYVKFVTFVVDRKGHGT